MTKTFAINQPGDTFTSRELAYLRFMRWLQQRQEWSDVPAHRANDGICREPAAVPAGRGQEGQPCVA
jgi:hypothetical protein